MASNNTKLIVEIENFLANHRKLDKNDSQLIEESAKMAQEYKRAISKEIRKYSDYIWIVRSKHSNDLLQLRQQLQNRALTLASAKKYESLTTIATTLHYLRTLDQLYAQLTEITAPYKPKYMRGLQSQTWKS